MKKIGRKGVPGNKWYMKKKSETYGTFWKGQAVKCDERRKRSWICNWSSWLEQILQGLQLSYGF